MVAAWPSMSVLCSSASSHSSRCVNGAFLGLHNWLSPHHIPFPESVNAVLGLFFAPIAWIIGIPWHAARMVGDLLGTRMVLNELVAYANLGKEKEMLDPRSFTIATFALCGFANIGSIGMQIGGIGALVPARRNDLAKLGLRAMFAGTMANLMSASIVGILLSSSTERLLESKQVPRHGYASRKRTRSSAVRQITISNDDKFNL